MNVVLSPQDSFVLDKELIVYFAEVGGDIVTSLVPVLFIVTVWGTGGV